MLLRKLFIPTDFSKNALNELEFTINLFGKFNAELILLHVADLPAADARRNKSSFSSFSELKEIYNRAIIEQLKMLSGDYPDITNKDLKIQFTVKFNNTSAGGFLRQSPKPVQIW